MLNFLVGIANTVYDFFNRVIYSLFWYHDTGHSGLTEYIYSLRDTVRDYVNDKQFSVRHFHYNIRNKADDILLSNYGSTRFVAVDSYPDVWYHRFVTKPYTDNLALVQFYRLQFYTSYAHENITRLGNAPPAYVDKALYSIPQQMNEYLTDDKPYVTRYKAVSHHVDNFVAGYRPSFIIDFTDNLHEAVRDYVFNKAPAVNSLVSLRPVLDELGTIQNRAMLKDMREKTYAQMKMVLDKAPILEYVGEKKRLDRIDYLTGDRFKDLAEFLEDPDAFIYKAMLHTFDEYVLYQLIRWKKGIS